MSSAFEQWARRWFLQFPTFCFAGDAKSSDSFRPALPCPSSSLIYSCQLVLQLRRGLCFPRAVAFNVESVSVSYIRKTWCILNPIIFSPLWAVWKPACFDGCRTAVFLSLLSAVRDVDTTLTWDCEHGQNMCVSTFVTFLLGYQG